MHNVQNAHLAVGLSVSLDQVSQCELVCEYKHIASLKV